MLENLGAGPLPREKLEGCGGIARRAARGGKWGGSRRWEGKAREKMPTATEQRPMKKAGRRD